MKRLLSIRSIFFVGLLLCTVISCEYRKTDFGFDGSISGTLKDETGSIVPGDLTSANLVVRLLGEGDFITTNIRVKGDGTFANTHLEVTNWKIWVDGPVFPIDTIRFDMRTQGTNFNQEIVVTPCIAIDKPVVSGNPTSTSVDIIYSMTGNRGLTASNRVVYCSTVQYPCASIGTGTFHHTVTTTLSTDSGTATVTGLKSGTKYYLRIGANASGKGMNYSDQIIFTTP